MPWRLTLHRNIHAACVPVLNRISTVVAAAHLVNDVSLLVFNQGEESFLVFSPVWIPRRDLHCISPQPGTPPKKPARTRSPSSTKRRHAENVRQKASNQATGTSSQGQRGAPGPRASTRPVLQTLASAETQSHTRQKCGISLEVVAPAAHTPVLSRRRQPGRRCAAHL